jgi:hypothetical protein
MEWTFRGVRPHSCRLTSLACKSKTEVVLWPFDPIRTTATSLACNSESKVGFHGPSIPFALPPPPLQARARRRWVFMSARPCSRHRHLPSHATARQVSFMSFQPLSHFRHLPRMQERDGGDFYVISTPFAPPPPPPSYARASQSGFLGGLDPVHAAVTSPTYNSESDVGFYGPSTLFAPLLPPRMQQRVGGGPVVCMVFRPVRAAAISLACNKQSGH